MSNNHIYSHHKHNQQHNNTGNLYSGSRSAIDNNKSSYYYSDSSSSRYYPSSYADYLPSDPAPYSSYTPSSSTSAAALWRTSRDLSSPYSKRSSDGKRPKFQSACNLPVYPQRPGEKDCAHYMLTRTCRFGDACKFDHPIWVPDGGIPDWKEIQLPPIPSEFHPERPGELDCPHFLKTQKCKFGLNCKFNHPKDKICASDKTETATDLPERPSEPNCSFYVKTGKCKFGATCKFHHPKDIQIPSDEPEAPSKEQTNGNRTSERNEVKTLIIDPAPSFNSKGLPVRLGEADCPFYMKTGSCKYAANCRYNHPDRNDINPPVAVGHSLLASPIPNLTMGLVNSAAAILQSFQPGLAQTAFGPGAVIYPQRPGQPACDYYMKAGVCKYGEMCKFDHPVASKSVKLTLAGFPRREGAVHCPFYMKTGTCKYGATCKYDHPPPGEVIASTGKENDEAPEKAKENEENDESSEE
ncbi:hypothetical protein vseg_001836 [Gypsophila vaccaria]